MSDVLVPIACILGYVVVAMIVTRVFAISWETTPGDVAPLGVMWPAVLAVAAAFYAGRALWLVVDRPFTAFEARRAQRALAAREVERWLESDR